MSRSESDFIIQQTVSSRDCFQSQDLGARHSLQLSPVSIVESFVTNDSCWMTNSKKVNQSPSYQSMSEYTKHVQHHSKLLILVRTLITWQNMKISKQLCKVVSRMIYQRKLRFLCPAPTLLSDLRPDCQMQLPSVPVFVLFCKSIQDQNIIATL